MDTDPHPERHPEPGFFTYAGDSLTITLAHDGRHIFALRDRTGQPIGHGTLSDLHFRIDALSGGRELLPVRPEPEPQPDPKRYSPPISFSQPDGDALSVTHAHPHEHPTHPNAQPVAYEHTHNHAHTGPDVIRRSHAFGHWNDPHRHEHDPDDPNAAPRATTSGAVGPSDPPWR